MDDPTVRSGQEVSLFFTMAAMAGGLLWGMVRIAAVVGGPAPYNAKDVGRAAMDALFALISAFISALFVSPGIVAFFAVTDSRGIGLIYLLIGLGFWQMAPLIIRNVVRVGPALIQAPLPQIMKADSVPETVPPETLQRDNRCERD